MPMSWNQPRARCHKFVFVPTNGYCQKHNVIIVLIVYKEGLLARVLEHMVDTVLYFEGERGHTSVFCAVKTVLAPR